MSRKRLELTVRDSMSTQSAASNKRSLYLSVWRWHFYAGLFVVPFLIILSVTGLIMLYQDQIESISYSRLISVEPGNIRLTPEEQKNKVWHKYPNHLVSQYQPGKLPDQTSEFTLQQGKESISVFVDPYSGAILGELDRSTSLYALANEIHGSLLLGDIGDAIVELAISLTLLLILTGLYLWWPRNWRTAFWPGLGKGRGFWRNLHVTTGAYLALYLIFFGLSGLSWTGIWGSKLVQPWSSFPMEKSASQHLSDRTHVSLNRGALKEVPWNLELTPLPKSTGKADDKGLPEEVPTNLDSLSALAGSLGLEHYRIYLPTTQDGVYTLAASTMGGELTDASQDRTLHFDRYTGKLLADIGFQDYSPMAKSMAVGIALHEGKFGVWNLALNTAACLGVIALCVTGILMWWKRRPHQSSLLSPPPIKNHKLWKQVCWLVFALSLFFPLAAMTLLGILILDQWLLPKMKTSYQ